MTVKELQDRRNKAIADARGILDAAGDKGLSQDDTAKYDAFMSDADKLKGQIERAKRMEDADAEQRAAKDRAEEEARNVAPPAARGEGQVEAPEGAFVMDTREARLHRAAKAPEYRAAYSKAVRLGTDALNRDEKRSLTIGQDTAGGYLAPDEYERTMLKDLVAETIVRQRASVMSSVSGDRQIPFESGTGTAYWTAEEAAATESDVTFGLKTIGAHKLTRLVKVSQELIQDSVFDLESYLREEFARSFNAAEDTAFISGNGVSRPRGFTMDGTAGVTAASATAITADELIDLYHSLAMKHRPASTWYMADATLKAIRKLKDGNGNYLWQPSFQADKPDLMLGKPLAISDDMPAMTTGLKAIWFGNLKYYRIVDRAGFYMTLLRELYAVNGQVGFIGYKRVDARLMLDTPMRYITMA